MIQLDEKLPQGPPPSYQPLGPNGPPSPGPGYPPQQSPGAGASHYQPPMQIPQGYAPSPGAPRDMQQPFMQQPSPAMMEAQLGNQYQQQCEQKTNLSMTHE